MLTVQEAIKNIIVVVRNSKMNGDEHDALRDSMNLVAQRCELADKLEKEKNDAEAAKKIPEIPDKE